MKNEEEKREVYNRLRYGHRLRESEYGGYVPYKRDMENDSYYLTPEQIRSILSSIPII